MMPGQAEYEAWRAAVPDWVCNVPAGPWDELSPGVRAGFAAIAEQDAPDLELAAIIAERNQLRQALILMADDGNQEAADHLDNIRPARLTEPKPAPELPS